MWFVNLSGLHLSYVVFGELGIRRELFNRKCIYWVTGADVNIYCYSILVD